ncbi:uncharacterized protein EV420DRAFT_1207547 [Desarmillaria tabescens]|uniref:Fe2OG dioxygenase domain-containing protein n=1 Tax=Armillaria tabescens TaxID=1929756 RepID=A0AA39J9V7_ARMTA|nr:uncharacterized protein EV420DRAFT_1207547 [Desarmillaria tabescens]KAK0438850.1 hypothetical protein EV420DRAFT_1207547 [Desarmillaria tabescens]
MPSSQEPEHPVLAYVDLNKHIKNRAVQRQGVVHDSPVIEALNNLSSHPFVSFTLEPYYSECEVTGPGETSFGTLGCPDIDAIGSKSTPSSFGKGDQTVFDPTYRDGHEINAGDIIYPPYRCPSLDDIASHLKVALGGTLFLRKEVEVRLYKLALYDKGGHFDWHRDSTHGDDHHATVLVALNTTWKGGALHLRHGGEEVVIDMQPKVKKADEESQPEIHLKAAAFYTDVEHKVEPVTEGVRIILQYDVFVSELSLPSTPNSDTEDSKLDMVAFHSSIRCDDHGNELQATSRFASEDSISALVDAIQEIISSGTEEVGIPLRYLYRQASIREEYLKGLDAIIYARLSEVFDVELAPVILEENSIEGKWTGEEFSVYKASSGNKHEEGESPRKRARRPTEFHLSAVSEIVEISRTDYIEHTGNESQEADCRYFGGGMFLRAKNSEA